MILFSGRTEYSDRKVIILPHYTIPCLPLSNTVVVCYGRVHCRIQSWIPGSLLIRLTVRWPTELKKASRTWCTAKRALAIAYRGKTMQAASGAAKADQGLALSHLHSQYARLFEPASCLACHRWQPAWLPTTFWPRTAARSEAASLPSWSRCTRLSVAALPEGAFRHGRCATNVPLPLIASLR